MGTLFQISLSVIICGPDYDGSRSPQMPDHRAQLAQDGSALDGWQLDAPPANNVEQAGNV
jgi:hypothetical protein